jgi:hypothetical protein
MAKATECIISPAKQTKRGVLAARERVKEYGSVSQLVEEADSKSVSSRFESGRSHQNNLKGERK